MTRTLTAEIVTFRAAPGIGAEEMRTRAAGVTQWLERQPGFVARTLSHAEDGSWTDHVVWASRAEALAAGEAFMAEPSAAPFMQAIAPASVAMSHAEVVVRQTAPSDMMAEA
ncbi:hypothetical protein OU426_05345 [Frigidibacter sp. RF13]|uniref:hypothetical protein n=1 Tax=Frigidibacter sp. RF13 TaxID=2997340 RepID=UPI002270E5C1|nr:hypothetical protein [Frigidibacter sp. RF13]MCY1126274.1 hypothetical protein [Frigidibacter sp. RF13]